MNAELLLKYKQLGIEFSLLNGSLQVSAPKGVATPELKKRLAEDKPVIMSALEFLRDKKAHFATTHRKNCTCAEEGLRKAAELLEAKIVCADCKHFKPDTIGNGSGLGECASMPSKLIFPPPYPHAKRECNKFEVKKS
jgi:hypothetical protein